MTTKATEELSTKELEKILEKRKKEERKAAEEKQKAFNKRKNEFVLTVAKEMSSLSARMIKLKEMAVTTGNELHKQMYEVFDKEEKTLQSFTIVSEDGKTKIEIQRQDRYALDETAEVAINTIKKVFEDKFAQRNQLMYKILNNIMMKNVKGDYDEKLVAKLRKHEQDINDPEFSKALDDLSRANFTSSTATYVRSYKLNEANNKWEDIPMQFSSL